MVGICRAVIALRGVDASAASRSKAVNALMASVRSMQL